MPDPRDPRGYREVVPAAELVLWEITWLAGSEKVTMTFPAAAPEDALDLWRIEFDRDGVRFVALVRGPEPDHRDPVSAAGGA